MLVTVKDIKEILAQIVGDSKMHTKNKNKLTYVLLLSYWQIDDKEFDIPQVDTPPTLESILNEVK